MPTPQFNPGGTPPPYGQPPQNSGYSGQPVPPGQQPPTGAFGASPTAGQAPQASVGVGPADPNAWGHQPPAKPAGKKTGLIIGIGTGALVLVLILGWVLLPRLGGAAAPTSPTVGTEPRPAGSASEAVQQYFDALKSGDVATLSAIAVDGEAALSGLTSEAISSAAAAGPVQDLKLDGYDSSVNASYTINGTQVTTYFDLVNTGSGWKIKELAAEVSGMDRLPEGVKATVNGAAVDEVRLTPGVWTLATTNKYVTFSPNSLLIDQPGYSSARVEAELTDEGSDAIEGAITEKLSSCESDPYGCGLSMPKSVIGGGKVNEKSMKCSMDSGDLDDLEIKIGYDGKIGSSGMVSFECKGRSSSGSPIRGNGYASNIVADISNPADIQITLN